MTTETIASLTTRLEDMELTMAAERLVLVRLSERCRKLEEMLRDIEFVTVVADKCPVCLGFEANGDGETRRHHNSKCRLNALLNESA